MCSIMCASALAQTPADISAQQLQRQQQRDRAQSEQAAEHVPDVRLPREPGISALDYLVGESPCFPIGHIELQGESAARFNWALRAADDALGRCLGSGGVNAVLSRVQNALIGAGYVTTRVVAAPQDLHTGTLILTVVPGRIHAIRFAAPDQSGGHRNALPIAAGALLNVRDIEQTLENFKRIPTADADMQIVPAELPGESDLVIQWRQAFPLRLSVAVDDGGSQVSGKYQGNTTVSLDNPLGWQDLFYVSVGNNIDGAGPNGSRGTRSYALHYSVPFGYWLASASANHYQYHQSIVGATQTYIYSGGSDNVDLKLARVVYRDAVRKSSLSLRLYQRSSDNFIDDTEVQVQRRRMGGFELGLQHKEFIGAATLDGSLAYKIGTGAFSTLAAPEETFDEGTSRPRIVNFDLALSLPFSIGARHLQYQASLRAQWNRTRLIAQDRFAIGGRYTVRGFDGESSLSAERGRLLRNDLIWTPEASNQQFYLGLDYAEVGGPSVPRLLGTHLAGAAIGWRGQLGQLQYDIFTGAPISTPKGFRTAGLAHGFNLNYQF